MPLKRQQNSVEIARRKTQAIQPEILAGEAVAALLEARRTVRQHALLTATYAAGLRVAEVCALKVSDIDSARMMLWVNSGKGGRDRYSLLSPRLLDVLRAYWRDARPGEWLLPMRDGLRPIETGQAQKMVYAAKRDAGITKQGGIHTLRHAFTTHLLVADDDGRGAIGQLCKSHPCRRHSRNRQAYPFSYCLAREVGSRYRNGH